jgi:hypothetical protein
MSQPRDTKKYTLEWTDNLSQPIAVSDYRNIEITVVGDGTVSVLGTKDINVVDFSSASTLSNSYAEIVIADETVTSANYVTELTVSDSTKVGELNTNMLTFICVSRDSSDVDAFITLTNNQ